MLALRGLLAAEASLAEEHRLQAYDFSRDGSRALKDTGSVVVLLGFSHSEARGIFLDPRSGIKPMSTALAGRFLTTGPPGKARRQIFFFNYFFYFGYAGYLLLRANFFLLVWAGAPTRSLVVMGFSSGWLFLS